MKEAVNPIYYKGAIQPIDLIDEFNLNFNRGCIVKYVVRAGKKDDELQDLEKALWYLEREISRVSKEHEQKRETASRVAER